MGTIWKRANGRWSAQTEPVVDEKTGKRKPVTVGTFDTKREAKEELRAFETRLAEGSVSYSPAAIRKRRLGEWLRTDWFELLASQVAAGELARNTEIGYQTNVRNYIAPHVGRLRIGELNGGVVYRWLLRLRGRDLSDRTVQHAYRTLFRAMGDTGLPVNPASLPKHRLPRIKETREKTRPSLEEVTGFLAHVEHCDLPDRVSMLPVWRMAAVTGVRRGELCGLSWDDVDFENGTIQVTRSLAQDGPRIYVKATKNEGTRTLGVDAHTLAILKQHRAHQRSQRLRTGADYNPAPLGVDFMFRWDKFGAPITPMRLTVRFRREWKHSGGRAGVSLQSLRRSHGTELLASGLPVTQAAARMGHSPDVFLRLYVRDNDDAARQKAMRELAGKLYG